MTSLPGRDACSLLKLPLTVLEQVLGYLDHVDIYRFRRTCRYVNSLCAHKIRRDFRRLERRIRAEVGRAEQRCRSGGLRARESNLKYKYMLRVLDVEVSLMVTVFRQVLRSGHICYSLGELMHEFAEALRRVRNESIASWADMKACSRLIQRKVSRCLDGLGGAHLGCVGAQMLDLLDVTRGAKFVARATYNTRARTCRVCARYQLDNVRILNFLPDLSAVLCRGRPLSGDEGALLVHFFALVIKMHNYLVIQDQHYQERIRAYGGEPRPASPARACSRHSRALSDCEIQEVHRNIPGLLKYSGRGLWFEINLQCSVVDAPLQVLNSWERIANDVEKRVSDSISDTNQFNSYTISIKFKKYLSDNMNCIHIVQA